MMRIDDVYHGVLKHPLLMVSSFIGVSHQSHPSASSLSVIHKRRRPSLLSPWSALSIVFAHRRFQDTCTLESIFPVIFHPAVCFEAVSRYAYLL